MNTTNRYFLLALISWTVLASLSCKKRDIKGEEIRISNIGIGIKSDNGTIIVPKDSNFSVSSENLTVPLELTFSDAVPKRFNVDLSVDNDTITKMIAEGKLPNTVLLPSQFYKLPTNLDVPFGLENYGFNLVVDITAIERNYGKTLALAVNLHDPTKANTLQNKTDKAIILINTADVISEDQIHYIYFEDAGSTVAIPQQGVNYSQNSTTLTVPVTVSLGGIAAGAFNVQLTDNQDTLQQIITADGSDSLIALKSGVDYALPDFVAFKSHQSTATFNLEVRVDTLKNKFDKHLLIGLSLEYPTGHLLDSARRTVVLDLDPTRLVEADITNLNSTYSFQRENDRTSGEGAAQLIDNNTGTKYLLFDFRGAWVQLEYPEPQLAGAYTLTSGGDAANYPGRNPAAWQLLGSNDGASWKTLDAQTNQSFTASTQTKKYYFKNNTAYKYYRLNFIKIQDGDLFQLAEWRLIQTP